MAKSIDPPTIKTQYNPPQRLFERPLRVMFVKTGRLLRCSDIVETAKKKTNYTFFVLLIVKYTIPDNPEHSH